jgi:hypothetical protein
MHPYLSQELALVHRHDLEVAACNRTRSNRERHGARTRLGLSLVRLGLHLSRPLTPAMIIATRVPDRRAA